MIKPDFLRLDFRFNSIVERNKLVLFFTNLGYVENAGILSCHDYLQFLF